MAILRSSSLGIESACLPGVTGGRDLGQGGGGIRDLGQGGRGDYSGWWLIGPYNSPRHIHCPPSYGVALATVQDLDVSVGSYFLPSPQVPKDSVIPVVSRHSYCVNLPTLTSTVSRHNYCVNLPTLTSTVSRHNYCVNCILTSYFLICWPTNSWSIIHNWFLTSWHASE